LDKRSTPPVLDKDGLTIMDTTALVVGEGSGIYKTLSKIPEGVK
jgi:hypothetical protein